MTDLIYQAFHTVRVGRNTVPFTTCAEVSAAYRATIEEMGVGASETPPCHILDADGRVVGHVSYNGRVWLGDGRDWTSDTRPIYDPRGDLNPR